MLARFASWMESFAGTAVLSLVLIVLTAFVLFVSAAVSMRIYARRDL